MSTFPRTSKTSKTSEGHKTAAAPSTGSNSPPPPHQQAVPAVTTPTIVSAEEIRSRIAAARKMKSDTSLRSTYLPQQSYSESSLFSRVNVPHHSFRRSQSITPLNKVITEQTYRAQLHHPVLQNNRQPARPSTDPRVSRSSNRSKLRAENHRTAFTNPGDVPILPLLRKDSHRSLKSRSSMPRVRSPLSNVAMEEGMYF
jgi:hypothetical protein